MVLFVGSIIRDVIDDEVVIIIIKIGFMVGMIVYIKNIELNIIIEIIILSIVSFVW